MDLQYGGRMPRRTDWSLLVWTDPAPGKVEDVLQRSKAWSANVTALGDAQTSLSGTTVNGSGAAVEAARTLLTRNAALAGTFRDACENTAQALSSWATSLAVFQHEADLLYAQAEQANDNLQQGQAMIKTGQHERATDASRAPAAPDTSAGDVLAGTLAAVAWKVGDVYSDIRGNQMVSDAQDTLEGLRRMADDLRHRHLNESRRIANMIHMPTESDAVNRARLDTHIPLGDGSVTALLAPGNDPDLVKLDELRAKLDGGDASARNEYFALLASLTPEQLAMYGFWKPQKARDPLPAFSGEDVAGVKQWWAGLDEHTKRLLIGSLPGVIGNLNGIPYSDRANANLRNITALNKDPGTSPDVRNALGKIREKMTFDDGSLRENRSVISFDPAGGKPLAAIAIGNMDTARNVTWNIPGMGTTVADGMASWTDSAQDLYDRQRFELDRLSQGDVTNAVVSWVGYDTPVGPPSPEVLEPYKAQAGAVRLAAALDGFYETRADGTGSGVPKINVVAHSYGTTTASYALTKVHHQVDTGTFFGSAGIDPIAVPNAGAMHIKNGADHQPALYVTQALDDRVAPYIGIGVGDVFAPLAGHLEWARISPSAPWFGGHTFSADGGYDPQTGQAYKQVTGHDAKGPSGQFQFKFDAATTGHGYLDPGTEANKDIALASIGRGDEIRRFVPLKQEWFPVLPNLDGSSGVNIDPWQTLSDEHDQDPATLGKPRG